MILGFRAEVWAPRAPAATLPRNSLRLRAMLTAYCTETLPSFVASVLLEEKTMLGTIANRLGTAWCRLMHGHVTWPVRGRYSCATCGRQYSVPWFPVEPPAVAPHPAAKVQAPRRVPESVTA